MSRVALQADGSTVTYTNDEIVYSSIYPYNYPEIFEWCDQREINCDLLWAGFDGNRRSEWGIKYENQRVMFALRWL
jgi:hypothetical protein